MEKVIRKPIDNNEFVKVWAQVHLDGGNLQDVANRMECSYAGARNKADRLISSGVELPELKRGRRPKTYDTVLLNKEIMTEMADA